jgi:hypothetical protein
VYPVDDSADPAQANGMFAPRSPTFFPFELAADELRKEEFVRLADAVPPTLEALRSLTPAQLRAEVTLMLERLGYLVHSDASAHDLVVTKDGRKYIVACAPPADREPTPTRDLARLHAAVVAATAEGGFYALLHALRRSLRGRRAHQARRRRNAHRFIEAQQGRCCHAGHLSRHVPAMRRYRSTPP